LGFSKFSTIFSRQPYPGFPSGGEIYFLRGEYSPYPGEKDTNLHLLLKIFNGNTFTVSFSSSIFFLARHASRFAIYIVHIVHHYSLLHIAGREKYQKCTRPNLEVFLVKMVGYIHTPPPQKGNPGEWQQIGCNLAFLIEVVIPGLFTVH
jgi:hypothetical protein